MVILRLARRSTICGGGEMLGELFTDPRVQALTVTEFNPHHGAEDGATTRRLLEMLASCLGPPD